MFYQCPVSICGQSRSIIYGVCFQIPAIMSHVQKGSSGCVFVWHERELDRRPRVHADDSQPVSSETKNTTDSFVYRPGHAGYQAR
uniref:Uncharacterized protein n=1 Tax=Anguilla anguilla TaxID=7936 RepID=A0A0E9X4I1_ANGAN